MRASPALRLGRAAIAAFGAAAVSTSIGACGARGGLDLGSRASPVDGSVVGSDAAAAEDAAFPIDDGGAGEDTGATHAEYGGPPVDAGTDAGELSLPAYGGPWFTEDAAFTFDAGTDAACEDPGCSSSDYGGPPAP